MKRLDLSTMTWYDMDKLPYGYTDNLVSFDLNNDWYVGMGASLDSLSDCCGVPLPAKKFWKYNPSAGQWTRLADFPGGHQNFPTCFSIGAKGYAFYGAIPIGDPNIAIEFTQELWEYDPGKNIWKQLILPTKGGPEDGEKYQIFSHKGKAYFLSSQKQSVGIRGYYYLPQYKCIEYDPLTGVFKQLPPMKEFNILKKIGQKSNTFYFQSDAFGYIDGTPQITYSLELE